MEKQYNLFLNQRRVADHLKRHIEQPSQFLLIYLINNIPKHFQVMKKNVDLWVHQSPTLKKLIMELKIAILIIVVGISNAIATPAEGSGSELQQNQVTGKVTDANGDPLPGVSVVVKGTTLGTLTDASGKYSLTNIAQNGVLAFSFIGMTPQEIKLEGQTVIDVILKEDAIGLEEVIVVGYGSQRKVTLTGSVSGVNAQFLESRPLTNTSQALQGIQGIYVNQEGGQPGADVATIRVRGVGTLNNNDPLVLVDGIEYSLKDVNPNDIESISVLKDAASASIYGNRAANGVILITTKKGSEGKMSVELKSYYGLQKATYLPDMVTNSVEWMKSRNQTSINEGQPPIFSDALVEEWENGTDPYIYPNTDWYDIMFSVTPIQDHSLRLSGGSESVTYSLSLGYLDQEGVLMGTDAKKYSFNSNVIYKYSDRLRFGASINGSYWYKREPAIAMTSFMNASLTRPLPIFPNILPNGNYGDKWIAIPGYNLFQHPVATAKESYLKTYTQRALVHFYTEYIFPLDIEYKIDYSINKGDINGYKWAPEIYLYSPKTPDTPGNKNVNSPRERHVQRTNNNDWSTTFFQTLAWKRKIADQHNVNLLLGYSRESFYNSDFNAYIEGFLGNELTELNAGTINKNVGGTSYESRLKSYFGRANYSFSDKYLLEFNFRYDGSSRFAKDNRWGFFPSFSAGWRLNEESFMSNIEALNNFKLRFSWGQLGNQSISLYSYLNNLNINQGTTFDGQVLSGSAVTTLSDPNISWETTTITNIGLDIGLWNNNLEIIVDVFEKNTKDILARINVPGQVGNLTGPITNLYGISNKGVEVSASHSKTLGKLRYKIGGNITYVNNVVDYLAGEVQYISPNTYGIQPNIQILKEGYPVNSWYLYEAIGIFQSQEEVDSHAFQHQNTKAGDLKYRDVNNDGIIDGDDKQILGRTVPKYTYGFNMDFEYKGFDLGAFFQGIRDIDIYIGNNIGWPNMNGAGITKDYLANYWTPENPNAKYPRLFEPIRGYGGNAQNSTFWLHDASYLRLKNLQLGFTIPSNLINRININKIRLYVNAQNYLTFSKFKLTDPEKNISRQSISDYPTTKILSFGANVTF